MRELILNNFWAKAGSLVLAVMIWHVVNTWQQGGRLQSPTVTLERERAINHLPITMMKSAEDERGFRITPNRVDVILRGPADLLNNLSVRDVQVFVDLTDIVLADNLSKRVQVHHPPGVKVDQVKPATVRIELMGK